MSEPQPLSDLVGRVAAMAKAPARRPPAAPQAPQIADWSNGELEEIGRRNEASELQREWHEIIPQRYHKAKPTDLEGEAYYPQLTEWSLDPQGRNLVLFGPVGVGKTHVAIAACWPSHVRHLDIAFWPVVELLDALRPGGSAGIGDLVDVDRLIVDDLGRENSTEWAVERLYAIVNRRWLERRPTIYTTNVAPNELATRVGEAMFSRIVKGAVCIEIKGADRRGKA